MKRCLPHYTILTLASALAVQSSCSVQTDDSVNTSTVLVDLGADGNAAAASAYENFDASRCGNATHAILAFKTFDGGQRNATQDGANEVIRAAEVDRQAGESSEETIPLGTVTPDEAVASATATETETETATTATATAVATATNTNSTTQAGLLLADDGGFDVDVVDVDGTSTCIVRAPVNLHTPALARKIANNGTITNFYMTGQRSGPGYVEAGATNTILPNATTNAYYDANGQAIPQRNTSGRIAENREAGEVVNSTFDQTAVSEATGIRTAPNARAANNYICNATSYVLTQQGELQYLPGLTLPAMTNPVRTGFVHVPDNATAAQVATIMRATLRADQTSQTRAGQGG